MVKVACLKSGTYDIEVAEVLQVSGSFFAGGSEDVIVKDTNGSIWAIPEDRNYDKPGKRLISRYDVRKGMKLRVVVAQERGERDITEVIVLKK